MAEKKEEGEVIPMESVGDYEYCPKDIIGHGAFAVVFKGRHKTKPDFVVAIKSITKKNISQAKANLPNFLGKEIKILQELTKLHHENVVALYDFKETPLTVLLAMEYCVGGDLADYLTTKGTLSEDTIRIFVRQLAGGMKAFCALGILHRDLKPQNILISYNVPNPKPSEIKLKIADFGFARFLGNGIMAATLCGSPMYMAPEVIMSLKYDAKADLWSLGTIIYQCLTGKAPFNANSPHALKLYYEQNPNLCPKIPIGTSPELADLLLGLLKRNANERMNFDELFTHKFLQQQFEPSPSNSRHYTNNSPLIELKTMCNSPPNLTKVSLKTPPPPPQIIGKRVIKKSPPTPPPPESPTKVTLSTSPDDDYVMVPKNIQFDQSIEEILDKQQQYNYKPVRTSPIPCATVVQSPRPSFLPISEPIPVPTQRENYLRMNNQLRKDNSTIQQQSPTKGSVVIGSSGSTCSGSVPRSQPINMKRLENRKEITNTDIDISSLSPPSVQFMIGTTTTTSRRRSTSGGSLSETPPPTSIWTVSPTSTQIPTSIVPITTITSPLRRCSSGTSPPSPLTKILNNNTNNNDNNNLSRSPITTTFCTRTITLPEISDSILTTSSNFEQPIMFYAPELPEETLFEKEHNDTLAKINFVLALSNCILELASYRSGPLAALVDPSTQYQPQNIIKCRAEQFVLLVRALQLLGSGLALANKQLKSRQLRPSTNVKKVVSNLNTKFRSTLSDCKKLSTTEIVSKSNDISADKLLFNHAIQICQSAALDELFNKSTTECFERYQTAQILLHSLSQVQQLDSELLTKYKEAVEKRLYILQQQGYVYSTESI